MSYFFATCSNGYIIFFNYFDSALQSLYLPLTVTKQGGKQNGKIKMGFPLFDLWNNLKIKTARKQWKWVPKTCRKHAINTGSSIQSSKNKNKRLGVSETHRKTHFTNFSFFNTSNYVNFHRLEDSLLYHYMITLTTITY